MSFNRRTYLDFASAAPTSTRSRKAFLRALSAYGNPSSPHEEGRRARALLEEARRGIAHETGAKSEAVIFTSGATEANNLAIRGVIRSQLQKGRKASDLQVLYQLGAHASLTKVLEELKTEGVQVEPLAVKGGSFDEAAVKAQFTENTVLAAMEAASSETGRRFDTRRMRHLLDASEARSALLFVDASQLPLVESIERTKLGADLISLDAQKIGGVRGIGALIGATPMRLSPIIYGGGQEHGLRPGTEALAHAAAFAEALSEAKENRKAFSARAVALRTSFLKSIETIPNLSFQGGKTVLPHIVSISLIGRDTDYLVALLDARGFAVATKSACETDAPEGSRAVLVETSDAAKALSSLRISWGPNTKESDLNRFAKALKECVAFLDQNPL